MSQRVIVLDEAEDELFEAKNGPRASAPVWARSSEVQSTKRWSVFSRRHLPPNQSSIFPSIVFINHDEDLWVVGLPINIGDQVIGEDS